MRDTGIMHDDPLWFVERRGRLTSSKIHDAIKMRKKGEGDLATRKNLKYQMLAEMSTDRTADHYVSMAMDWGIRTEPKAIDEYEYRTGNSVTPVGLIIHPVNERFAATPDGYIKPNGLLEVECPETETHYEYRATGLIPPEYLDQINWQMACAGEEIEWTDFVSYDPRINDPDLQMLVIRHERDEKRIAEMEQLAEQFLFEVVQLFEQIKRGGQSLESKLRESIRKAGKYPFADEAEERAFHDTVVP